MRGVARMFATTKRHELQMPGDHMRLRRISHQLQTLPRVSRHQKTNTGTPRLGGGRASEVESSLAGSRASSLASLQPAESTASTLALSLVQPPSPKATTLVPPSSMTAQTLPRPGSGRRAASPTPGTHSLSADSAALIGSPLFGVRQRGPHVEPVHVASAVLPSLSGTGSAPHPLPPLAVNHVSPALSQNQDMDSAIDRLPP